MSMCRVLSCVVGRGCLLWPVHFLGKTRLHKSSERSSLVSGPGLNSSPPEAKNPGIFSFSKNLSCWSWNFNTLATSCEELTHWKRPWCWERLKAGKGDYRGWDGWMASLTQWIWVWVNSGSCWWTGRPGMLQSMGSQRVRHDWVTELNWTDNVVWN